MIIIVKIISYRFSLFFKISKDENKMSVSANIVISNQSLLLGKVFFKERTIKVINSSHPERQYTFGSLYEEPLELPPCSSISSEECRTVAPPVPRAELCGDESAFELLSGLYIADCKLVQ